MRLDKNVIINLAIEVVDVNSVTSLRQVSILINDYRP